MRELKFKFWNKLARRFQPPSKYAIQGDGLYVSYDYEMMAWDDPSSFEDSILVPCQYTGLKDKNGKEICEGDIIQLEGSPITYSIEWNKYQWAINAHGALTRLHNGALGYDPDWNIQPFNHCVYERAIVVGNIFENSDLLKQ
jgi:uncharacterized phage protein (TIGR01671 family)